VRNKFECEALAEGIDMLRTEGVPDNSLGLEILLRRLTGVHTADSSGSWGAADAVAWSSHGGSLLPRQTLRAAYKDAEIMKRAMSSTTPRAAFGDKSSKSVGSMSNKGFKYSAKPKPMTKAANASDGKEASAK
jgi:hypothetical protein